MWWRAALVVLAIAAALAPIPGPLVESFYARGLFPVLQFILTNLSNQVAFAVFDGLAASLLAVWTALTLRDVFVGAKSGWLRALMKITVRTATLAAAAYLAFLVTWGFNYRRVPLADKLQFDATRVSAAAAAGLADQAVERVNALYESAHHAGWPPSDTIDPLLAEAFARAMRDLGSSGWTVPSRPKHTLLDAYFLRAGVAGMTDPYFLETFVASDLLPFERPAVIAHEWSHLAGLADEGDANFAGWLTCLRGTPSHQYSGWLFLYGEVVGALDPDAAKAASEKLAEGPRDDLRAIHQRLEQHVSPLVSRAGWRVYDRYLKANKVERGAASYADVIRLVLGTRFNGDWQPALR